MCLRYRSSWLIRNLPQIYRHLVQHLIQRQLAKSLVATSDVAKLYRSVTSKAHVELVSQFLKFGVPLGIETFDQLLKHSLELLVPVYRSFLLFSEDGAIMRDNQIHIIAEALDVSATIIQCVWRRKHAKDVFKVLHALRLKVIEDNKVKMLNHKKFRSTQKR